MHQGFNGVPNPWEIISLSKITGWGWGEWAEMSLAELRYWATVARDYQKEVVRQEKAALSKAKKH